MSDFLHFFSKEDIEKYGFIYEPDRSKCRMIKAGVHFDCNYYKNGEWTNRSTPEVTDEWKDMVAEAIKMRYPHYTHIHSVWVHDNLKPLSGEGVMCRWLWMDAHDGNTQKG